MRVPYRDILDYLGYRGKAADDNTLRLVKESLSELLELNSLRNTYEIWECSVDDSEVHFSDLTINSERLARHLKGCRYVSLFALTLGAQVDTLIRRYQISNMPKAVIFDATASVMAGKFVDDLEDEICSVLPLNAMKKTIRFSPGYGDFELSHQKDILERLDAARKIGLVMSDGYMLLPSKSITALAGFY